MTGTGVGQVWSRGEAYEPYVGRWSRLVAVHFVDWLGMARELRWLDAGCGTGALTRVILGAAAPAGVEAIDPSPAFVAHAAGQVVDARARFRLGRVEALPYRTGVFDVAVSGLVLNFVAVPQAAATEMARVVRPGGTVAAYVWDYAGEMQFMRRFWDAAVALDPDARPLDEGERFPLCHPQALRDLFRGAGFGAVDVTAIDVPTHFRDFDDYWSPFLGGQGPAPSYVVSLGERRAALRDAIRASLPVEADGSIRLVARAWAVRGTTPPSPGGRSR